MHIDILLPLPLVVVDVRLEAVQLHDRKHGVVQGAAGGVGEGHECTGNRNFK